MVQPELAPTNIRKIRPFPNSNNSPDHNKRLPIRLLSTPN